MEIHYLVLIQTGQLLDCRQISSEAEGKPLHGQL